MKSSTVFVGYNEFHLFYQEFIDGKNGVCHINENGFIYDLSTKQGDVVNGVKSGEHLSDKALVALTKYAHEIFTEFNEPLQLEFVVNEDAVTIVQMRFLKKKENKKEIKKPANVYATGKTFSEGDITIDVSEILVVDKDTKAEDLIGKHALIVKQDVAFSHILALSLRLDIPSMYAMGEDFKLPNKGKVMFVAINKESWIQIK